MRFAELDIPKALAKYAPQLSSLSAFFLPDQDQVNWVRKEIAIAASKDPPLFSRIWHRSFSKILGCRRIPIIPTPEDDG